MTRFVFFFTLLIILLLQFSCSVSLPEKLEIKASPSVSMGFGKKNLTLSDYLIRDELYDMFGDDTSRAVILFERPVSNTGNDAFEFFVWKPLLELPIDIAEYLNSLDFCNSCLKQISQSVTIPDITFSGSLGVLFSSNPLIQGFSAMGAGEYPISTPITCDIASTNVNLNTSGSEFVSAVIKSGSIELTVKLPGTWYDVSKTLQLSITQSGGLFINGVYPEDSERPNVFIISLDGGTFSGTASQLTISGSFTITPNSTNSTVTFGQMESESIALFTGAIESFSEITLPQTVMQPSIDLSQDIAMSEAFSHWVEEIVFNPNGFALDLSFTNGLPEGDVSTDNVLSLTVNSAALGISQTKDFMPAINSDCSCIANLANNKLIPTTLPIGANGARYLDFQIRASLPVDGVGNVILKNITAGEFLSLSGNFSFRSDWISAKINGSTFGNITGTFPKDGDAIDFSPLYDFFPAGIKFATVPVLLYVGGLDAFRLRGNVYADCDGNRYNLLGEDGALEEIPLLENMPVFRGTGENGNILRGALPESSSTIELSDRINDRPLSLLLRYEFSVGSFEITKESLGSNPSLTLKAGLAIRLPLLLTVNGTDALDNLNVSGVKIDLSDDDGSDLLGRTEPNSDSNGIGKYLGYLESGSITVCVTNNTWGFDAASGYFTIGAAEKAFNMALGTQTLNLTSDDLEYIRCNAFIPKYGVFIKNTGSGEPVKINLDGQLDVTLSGCLKTNVNETITF